MGIGGKLARNAFSRNRSVGTHKCNARSSMSDKKGWSLVKSYLCGDEFNSVLAEEDSTSARSSEVTVTQPVPEDSATHKRDLLSEDREEDIPEEQQNSTFELFHQEDAAIIIQSAFRNFLARRRRVEMKLNDDQELATGTESPSKNSVGTSIEVRTGNSIEVPSNKVENVAARPQIPRKARTQVLKSKEDWDDSTVSSTIKKMRNQHKLEATNRRERALAYAFSQQLRICSKKKQRYDETQSNMSWSWLERWMATRLPECSPIRNHLGQQFEPTHGNHGISATERIFDAAMEEKESCGSNEVSVHFDSLPLAPGNDEDGFNPRRNRLNAKRTIFRRKTAPRYHYPKVQAEGKYPHPRVQAKGKIPHH